MQTHYPLLPHWTAQHSSSGDVSEVLQLDTSAFQAFLPGQAILNVRDSCILPASTTSRRGPTDWAAWCWYFQWIFILLLFADIFACCYSGMTTHWRSSLIVLMGRARLPIPCLLFDLLDVLIYFLHLKLHWSFLFPPPF